MTSMLPCSSSYGTAVRVSFDTVFGPNPRSRPLFEPKLYARLALVLLDESPQG